MRENEKLGKLTQTRIALIRFLLNIILLDFLDEEAVCFSYHQVLVFTDFFSQVNLKPAVIPLPQPPESWELPASIRF